MTFQAQLKFKNQISPTIYQPRSPYQMMEPNSITAFDAIDVLWRRKLTVLKYLVCTTILVGLVTVFTAKTYKSDAKLFVRLGRENSSLDITTGLGENQVFAPPFNRESEINSITDMIQNKQLFGKIVDRIGAETILESESESAETEESETKSPGIIGNVMSGLASWGILNNVPRREKAIINLQKNVGVHASEKSNVIGIDFETYDPKLAQQVVSSIVEEYVRLHARIHRSQGSAEFLTDQTELAKIALEKSEDAFEEFKTKTKLISVDGQRQVLVDRIANLENQWMETEAARIAAETEIQEFETQLGKLSESQQISSTEGTGNEGIEGMRQDVFKLQLRREELFARYKATDARVVQAEEQLKAARKLFEEAEKELVETTQGPNKVYEAAKIEFVQKQPALKGLESKSNVLEMQIETWRKALAEFNLNEKEFLRLQRSVKIQEENYQRHSRTLLQANMDSSLQEENLSNLSICQAATLNPKPVRPNKMINLLAALFLGIMGGAARAILLEYRERSKDRRAHLESVLELAVIGSIPRQPARELIRVN